MNGDEVRATRFLRHYGYNAAEVDDVLRRIAVELDAGRPIGVLIAGAAFGSGIRGYDKDAVDGFLEQLRRQDHSELAGLDTDPWRDLPVGRHFTRSEPGDFTRSEPGDLAERTATPSREGLLKQLRQDRAQWRQHCALLGQDEEYLFQECTDAWHGFGQQPGTHLRLAWAGVGRRELRTAEQQTVASLRYLLPITVSTRGRTFTRKKVSISSRPGVAEIVRRRHGDYGRGRFSASWLGSYFKQPNGGGGG